MKIKDKYNIEPELIDGEIEYGKLEADPKLVAMDIKFNSFIMIFLVLLLGLFLYFTFNNYLNYREEIQQLLQHKIVAIDDGKPFLLCITSFISISLILFIDNLRKKINGLTNSKLPKYIFTNKRLIVYQNAKLETVFWESIIVDKTKIAEMDIEFTLKHGDFKEVRKGTKHRRTVNVFFNKVLNIYYLNDKERVKAILNSALPNYSF